MRLHRFPDIAVCLLFPERSHIFDGPAIALCCHFLSAALRWMGYYIRVANRASQPLFHRWFAGNLGAGLHFWHLGIFIIRTTSHLNEVYSQIHFGNNDEDSRCVRRKQQSMLFDVSTVIRESERIT